MNIVFNVATIFAEAFCYMILCNSLMEKRRLYRKPIWDSMTVILAIVCGVLILSFFIRNDLIKGAATTVFLFSISIMFYNSSWKTKIGCATLTYLAIWALDVIALILVMRITSTSFEVIMYSEQLLPFAVMISKVLLSILVISVHLQKTKPRNIEYIAGRDWIILMGLSLIFTMALIAFLLLCKMLDHVPLIVVPSAIGLMFSSLLVFWLLKLSAKQGRIITENALIRQQLDIEEANKASMLESYTTQDMLLHDVKAHMDSIQTMLVNGNYEDINSYVTTLKKEVYSSIYKIRTNNSTVDAVLNAKDKVARSKGIEIISRLDELSQLTLNPVHLVVVLSNTIDNAIEACEKLSGKKRIDLKMRIEDDILVYSVINPVAGNVQISDNKAPTSKRDNQAHGLGLQIVASSLKKLNGEYEINCDDGKFQFTALIKLAN